MKKTLFVLFSLLTILAMLLTACGDKVTDEPVVVVTDEPVATDEPVVVPDSKYSQAPMLDAMDLPPVDERVSDEPMVVPVVESIGEYGGTWHTATWWDEAGNFLMAIYDPPVRWKADYSGYEPGLLVKMPEWSDNGQTITMVFRKGLKWSDGEPFTTADLKFWWEDMALNEDVGFNQVPWWAYNLDGTTPITMEFPDDVTWVLKFDSPQYIMPYILAQGFWEWRPLMKPAHFLEQFHPDYNADASYDDLDIQDRFWQTGGYPCMMAWCLEEYKAGESWTWTRNPYYWKVDEAGNQLPYIDTVDIELVENEEVRLLNVAQGKYDIAFRIAAQPTDIPFLTEQAEAGGYHIQPGWMNGAGAWPGWIINMDYHEDQEYDPATETEEAVEIRELLRDKNFRKGLSVALDREHLIDIVWEGFAEPKNFTISPQSPHFASSEGQALFKEWAEADAEYDPDGAMAYFDAAGFVDADDDGWRDLPSGKPFTLIMDQGDWGGETMCIESNEVYKQNLEEVGVKVLVNDLIGQPDWGIRGDNGLFMLRNTHASELDLWTYPDWIFPLRGAGEGTRAFPMQGAYYSSGGSLGWPAEGPAKVLQDLYDKGKQMDTVAERDKVIWEAVRVYIAEGPFVIGASGDQPMPVVVKDNVHNVPEFGVLGPWAPGSPGNTYPEQYWIEQ
ncbi:MAG: hypothetical protein K8R89_00970 [Anaerolineae bacterium]|nr:hypothetical protein [Anaerolineae bacterium]